MAKRHDPSVVEGVLERLVSRGLVSDERLVKALVTANQGKRAVSASALRAKCEQRGASPEALDLIEDTFTPDTSPLLARFSQEPKDRARAARFLASRGFEEDAIEAALEAHFGSRD